MTYGPEMRASDGDREKIAGRLRDAHAEGRLFGEEFHDRLDALYRAQTYGELEPLVRDLPVARPSRSSEVTSAHPQAAPWAARRRTGGDRAMAMLWTIWGCAVAINLVVWVLVSVGSGVQYFWPMWVAGPAGAALVCLEAIRRAYRR